MATEIDNDLDQDLDEDLDEDTPEPAGEATAEEDKGSVVVADDGTSDDSTEDEREAKREARRQERHDYKIRKKEKDERLRRELASERTARQELEARLAIIERKSSGSDMANIDNSLKAQQQAYAYHKQQLGLATAQANGDVAAEATERMLLAKQRIDQLSQLKTAFTRQQAAPPPLDGRMVSHANKFKESNAWFQTEGRDPDSVVMRAIDDNLAAEGWDAKTPEYWEELEARKKKYLPHRANTSRLQSDRAIEKPKSIVSGSGRESAAVSSSGGFKLSADRVNALKEAGMWEDPKKRAAMVQSYRDYDKKSRS